MFHIMWRGWRKGKSRATQRDRVSQRKFRLDLEALETRALLSFAAPVSYNIGTQSDGFVPNAAPINVAEGLRKYLFEKLPSVVLTSAARPVSSPRAMSCVTAVFEPKSTTIMTKLTPATIST